MAVQNHDIVKQLQEFFQLNRRPDKDLCKGNIYISNYKYVRDSYFYDVRNILRLIFGMIF